MSDAADEKRFKELSDRFELAKQQFFECRRAWTDLADVYKRLVDAGRKQSEDYLAAFEDQLKLPHEGINETFQDYSTAITTYDNEHYEERLVAANSIYQISNQETELRRPHELQLKEQSYSAKAYEAYIDWQISRTKPKSNKVDRERFFIGTVELLDRAIARDPYSEHFWLKLYYFWSANGQNLDALQGRLADAVQKCRESVQLWQCYIHNAGRVYGSVEAVYEAYAETMNTPLLTNPSIIASVYMTIRSLDGSEPLSNSKEGVDFLKECNEHRGVSLIAEYPLGKLWSHILGDSPDVGVQWKRMSQHGQNSSRALFWLDRSQWEVRQGDLSAARNALKTACFKVQDYPQIVFDAALEFELVHGTSAEYDRMMAVVRKAAAALPDVATHVVNSDNAKRKYNSQEESHDTFENAEPMESSISDNVDVATDASNPPSTKRQKTDTTGSCRNREKNMILVRSLSKEITIEDLSHHFADCGQIVTLEIVEAEQFARVALIEFEDPASVYQSQAHHSSLQGHPIQIDSAEGTMLFVTNYPPSYQQEDIASLVSKHGRVLSVRMPSLMYDQKRRFAYIQMNSADEARAALQLDGTELEAGIKLTIALSNPDIKKERVNAATEARELFIKRVSWNAKEEDLRRLFSSYGTIVSIRLPAKFSTEHHDGICFIDYESAEAAARALEMNGYLLKGMALEVNLSKPPEKQRPRQPFVSKRLPVTSQTNAQDESQSSIKSLQKPDSSSIRAKTLAIMNLPDTVSEAQLRTLFEVHGSLRKVELRPDHGGAIVEYDDPSDAGRASLALSESQIAGSTISIGQYEELMAQPSAQKAQNTQATTSMMPRKMRGRQPPQKIKTVSKPASTAASDISNKGNSAGGANQDYFRSLL